METDLQGKQVYTIDDVARELGVSKTTVSRAISGKGRLSAETRAKVLDFIAAHNYRPNAVAQSLAQSRTYNLGLLLPGDGSAMDVSFFQECMMGICSTASKHNYDVLIATEDGTPGHQLHRIIDNHKVDGIIAARSVIHSSLIPLLKAKQLPFVMIGSTADPDVIHVDNNNREACRELVSLLISRGVRRMALLGGDENYWVTHSRLQGFQDACRQAGLPEAEQLIFMNRNTSAGMAEAVEIIAHKGTECILCMDDFICNLATIQLNERKIAVPKDVKVACFYDNILLEHMVPSVTSLRFDAMELGKVACQELLDLVEGKNVKSYILPGYQIILRDSTN